MPDSNPRTIEEAQAFVAHVQSLFMPWNIEGLLTGFTDDCVVRLGDTIANHWEGEWEDRVTGAKMKGRGVEIWIMRDGKIAVWEAAFNTNEAGKPSVMGLS